MLHSQLLIFLLQPSPEQLYLKPGICKVYCTWRNSMSWRSILSRSLNHSMFDSLFCVKMISHDWANDKPPVNPKLVQDLLLQLDSSKSRGPDGIHPRALKELAGVITRPPSMISESWQSGEVSVCWKLQTLSWFSGRARRMMRPVRLTSVPVKSWRRFGKAVDAVSHSIPRDKMPSVSPALSRTSP